MSYSEAKQKMKESCDVNKQPLLHINLMQKRRYNMNTVQRKKEERERERERERESRARVIARI